jgi:acetyltransferase-like isoleucine patch superfamily enzyme
MKYEFTGDTKIIYVGFNLTPVVLHRIRAIKNFLYDIPFGNFCIVTGELGGWIEKESNLSHDGDCWVTDDAQVYQGATVRDNASIRGNAHIYGKALICDDSIVTHNARVSGNAIVRGKSIIHSYMRVTGNKER